MYISVSQGMKMTTSKSLSNPLSKLQGAKASKIPKSLSTTAIEDGPKEADGGAEEEPQDEQDADLNNNVAVDEMVAEEEEEDANDPGDAPDTG